MTTHTWAVRVERDGDEIVTLSSHGYGGRDIDEEDANVIRKAAEHLLSFVGGRSAATAWTPRDGSLTIRFLQAINAQRAVRWHEHGGLESWSALEWAAAMAGEAGEACNAAKKLKRIEDQIANINLEDGRSLTDVEHASATIVDEVADTVIYGVLLAERVGLDLEEAI